MKNLRNMYSSKKQKSIKILFLVKSKSKWLSIYKVQRETEGERERGVAACETSLAERERSTHNKRQFSNSSKTNSTNITSAFSVAHWSHPMDKKH